MRGSPRGVAAVYSERVTDHEARKPKQDGRDLFGTVEPPERSTRSSVLMELAAAHEPPGNVGSLQRGALGG